MSVPAFTATDTERLWQNTEISGVLGSPDSTNGFPFGTGSQKSYNPYNKPLNWSPNFPLLTNLSINQVIALFQQGPSAANNYSLTISINYTIVSANQIGSPRLNFNIYNGNDNTLLTPTTNFAPLGPGGNGTSVVNYCTPTACPNIRYNVPITTTPPPDQVLQVVPWDQSTILIGNVQNFSFSATMSVRLIVTCTTGPELETRFCMSYCQANLGQCKSAYTDYCFSGSVSTPPVIPLTTDNACQLYFEQYYNTLGPDADIDRKIDNYCQTKFPSTTCFEPLFFASPPISSFEQELCACHLSDTCYQNYVNSLAIKAPNFVNFIKNSGIKDRCLISQCASGKFPSIEIGKVCLVPACINVVNFTNDGSIGSGGITINQDAKCQSIDNGSGGGGTNPNTPSDKSWWDKYWIWIVLGAGLLIVLIIIIIIVVASESKKKKIIYPR